MLYEIINTEIEVLPANENYRCFNTGCIINIGCVTNPPVCPPLPIGTACQIVVPYGDDITF